MIVITGGLDYFGGRIPARALAQEESIVDVLLQSCTTWFARGESR